MKFSCMSVINQNTSVFCAMTSYFMGHVPKDIIIKISRVE